MINYKISKINSKVSFITDVIFPLVILTLLLISIPSLLSFPDTAHYIHFFVLAIAILVMFPVLRLWPWRRPFRAEWNDKGVTVFYPGGRNNLIEWNNVDEIDIEGEKLEIIKKVVPVIWFFHVGKFSANAAVWNIKSGRPWFGGNLNFIHLKINGRWINIPVPKTADTFEPVMSLLYKLHKNSILQSRPKKLELRSLARPAQIAAIASIPIIALSFFIVEGGLSTVIPFLLLLILLLFVLFILALISWHAFVKQKTLFAGFAVFGRWAYIPGFIFLAIFSIFVFPLIKALIKFL